MTIPNGWHDATPAATWRLDEEHEQAVIKFATEHVEISLWAGLKTEAAVEFTEKQLKRCGWNGDWESRDLKTDLVRILVEEETYNGKVRQKVKAIAVPGASKPADPVKQASLIQRLKNRSGGASSGNAFGNAPQWDGTGPDPNDASEPPGDADTSFP